ncbi:cytochrome c, partial [Candidatus Sumerlaeota bacterium]|nr:cytochrome c [Candidatus Sumerlaeota bacterium]
AAAHADEPITFSKQIAPLMQKHCQSCHRPGEAAPMSLLDYASARPYAKSIKKAVTERTMPPWHADPRYGTYSNDRRLSDDEIATLVKWIDAGAQEGNPADLPKPLEFVQGWGIGTPDLVVTATKPFNVPATGIIDYQNIVMPPFPEDRWVTKLEIRPSNRNVAHHINLFRLLPGMDETKKGNKEFVTGYVPGGIVTEYPEGTALFFPKGTKCVLQAHYVTTGKEESDQTSIGFIFARKPVEKQIYNVLISNYMFAIPPNDPNYEVKAQWQFREPITVIGCMVHMHLRGKDYMFRIKRPDGTEEIMTSVPKYDFNWQMGYHFKDRPRLPAKTVIEGIAHMDNSKENPFNPDPNATVRYGPQTYDEMVMGFVFYTKDEESLATTAGAKNLGPINPEVGQAEPKSESSGAGN